MEAHVFVYGTLRNDALGRAGSPLTLGWEFVGYGSVGGKLYDFGAYPGAAPVTNGEARVRGELYRVADPATALPLVDRYEGCGPDHSPPHEFERDLVDVAMDDGGTRRAWIYWYRPTPPLGRLLASGDYLERVSPAQERSEDSPPDHDQ